MQGTANTREILVKYVLLIMDTPAEPAPQSPEYGAWYASSRKRTCRLKS